MSLVNSAILGKRSLLLDQIVKDSPFGPWFLEQRMQAMEILRFYVQLIFLQTVIFPTILCR